MQEIALFSRKLHSWHKFYTTAGRDGRDKSQLCLHVHSIIHCHHVHYAKSKYVYTSNVGSTKWLMASCPRHRAFSIVNVYTLYMLQRFQIPTKWLLSCALVCTLEIVFFVMCYCIAGLYCVMSQAISLL